MKPLFGESNNLKEDLQTQELSFIGENLSVFSLIQNLATSEDKLKKNKTVISKVILQPEGPCCLDGKIYSFYLILYTVKKNPL